MLQSWEKLFLHFISITNIDLSLVLKFKQEKNKLSAQNLIIKEQMCKKWTFYIILSW